MKTVANVVGNVAAWRKGLAALGVIAALGAVSVPSLALADGGTDYSAELWQEQVAASMGQPPGANLALPAPMMASGPMTQCGDVTANPAHFAANLVKYCRAHTH